MSVPALPGQLPDRLTLTAFGGVVLLAGGNVVAVKLSNESLPPFFGAGFRFGLAAVVLLAVVALRRIPLPKGQALLGTALYGMTGFAAAFAFGYWALQELPAAIAGVMMAAIPLLTLFLARLQRLEPLHWRGVAGGVIAVAGIAVLLSTPVSVTVPIGPALAMMGAVVSLAEAGIIVKKYPPSHPVATNGLAMALGGVVLLVLSRIANETWSIPNETTSWLVIAYLVLLGSVGVFGLYVFVLKRWTATGASYEFVLIPVVAILLAVWLLDEPVDATLILGGAVVLAGVYLGALSLPKRECPPEELDGEILARRCATT
ncbi:MAG: DMT family transporter [Acidimicrobiia bacterium]